MHRIIIPSIAVTIALIAAPLFAEIEVVDGLTIRRIADHDVVPDCTNLTVDDRGRVFASGPGYIRRIQLDPEQESVDQATTLIERPARGAHGLYCERDELYYVGDGGIWRVQDANDDGIADEDPVRMLKIKTGGEHDAHALRRGPDDCFYLIAGNNTSSMFELQNVERPAVTHPRAGTIWRISSDWTRREVWAHGFRNAFDFDFGPDHTIITFDSDGERDVSLPWYRPTRVYRVSQGDDGGWVTRSWKRPNHDPEMPETLAELGRGSPTGVLRSGNTRLPERFDDGTFVLDWTFGRIVFVADTGRTEVIAKATGNTGFAVTDLAAMPNGQLVVSVGGRGSQGAIYLIDATTPREGSAETIRWPEKGPSTKVSRARETLIRLRSNAKRELSLTAAQRSVEMLENESATRQEQLDAAALIIESVGGLGAGNPADARGAQQIAAVFDGYRSVLRPDLPEPLIERVTDSLLDRFEKANVEMDRSLRTELIRAVAVLEPNSPRAFRVIANDLESVEHPTEKLHRLIALARLPVPRSDEMTAQIIKAMIDIPISIEASGGKVDRNWKPRMVELMLALHRRDVLMPGRLVANSGFGHPTHLVWTGGMDPEELERTRIKWLRQANGRPDDPAVARFIAIGNDAVPRPVIRKWMKQPETVEAAQLALAKYPRSSDAPELIRAARSVDPAVRKAAERALAKLGVELPQRVSTHESTIQWLEDTDKVLSLRGDAEQGQRLFRERNCAKCHVGATALGPSLEGVSRRFKPLDLWRATVDPSRDIPDRYRAMIVLTEDDRIVFGIKIYESVDGITLMTAQGETVRLNADAIAEKQVAQKSLMPDGLLLGLSIQDAADLMAYLSTL